MQQVPEYLCPATEPSTHISCSKYHSIYVLPQSLPPTSTAESTRVSMSCHRAFHPHQLQQVPQYLCPATEPSTHFNCRKHQSIYVLPQSLPPHQLQQVLEYLCPAAEPSTTSGAASTRVSMSCHRAFHHIRCSKYHSIYVLPLSLPPTLTAESTRVSMSCHRAFHHISCSKY